jgi:hypothetical protein
METALQGLFSPELFGAQGHFRRISRALEHCTRS